LDTSSDGSEAPAVERFAGVAEIRSACAWPVHLPIGLGHHHRLALMDSGLRWADLNLERPCATPVICHPTEKCWKTISITRIGL
jgi:hypothetical protein